MDSRASFDPRLAKWHPKARQDYEQAVQNLEAVIEEDRERIQELAPAPREYAERQLDQMAEELRAELRIKHGHPPAPVASGEVPAAPGETEQTSMF